MPFDLHIVLAAERALNHRPRGEVELNEEIRLITTAAMTPPHDAELRVDGQTIDVVDDDDAVHTISVPRISNRCEVAIRSVDRPQLAAVGCEDRPVSPVDRDRFHHGEVARVARVDHPPDGRLCSGGPIDSNQ